MSYRAFKRLLGETSLERKCRFLFGAFILLLITSSFWLYARQTEGLAYDQLTTTCRLLVKHKVERQLASVCYALSPHAPPPPKKAKRRSKVWMNSCALGPHRAPWASIRSGS